MLSKIKKGIEKACQKRPISVEDIETIVQKIVEKISRRK